MKTTIDLPEELLTRSKIAAVRRRTSLKKLIVEGLEIVLEAEITCGGALPGAIERLKRGFHLGGKPLGRDEIHAR